MLGVGTTLLLPAIFSAVILVALIVPLLFGVPSHKPFRNG
jgi:hypothetical protein